MNQILVNLLRLRAVIAAKTFIWGNQGVKCLTHVSSIWHMRQIDIKQMSVEGVNTHGNIQKLIKVGNPFVQVCNW